MQQLSSLRILHFFQLKVYVIEPNVGLIIRAKLLTLINLFFEFDALYCLVDGLRGQDLLNVVCKLISAQSEGYLSYRSRQSGVNVRQSPHSH